MIRVYFLSATIGVLLLWIQLLKDPTHDHPSSTIHHPASPKQAFNLPESIKRGKELYAQECMSCHMESGEGLTGVYPPVAKADYLKKPVPHLIDIVLKGQEGEVIVNGSTYNTPMAAQAYLTDEKIADILNYVRNSWGNKGTAVTPEMVKKQRALMQ